MAKTEAEGDNRTGLLSLEGGLDDVRVGGDEDDNVASLGVGEEIGVDGGGALGGRREDHIGGVLALDGRQTDVGVLEVGSCMVNDVSLVRGVKGERDEPVSPSKEVMRDHSNL